MHTHYYIDLGTEVYMHTHYYIDLGTEVYMHTHYYIDLGTEVYIGIPTIILLVGTNEESLV